MTISGSFSGPLPSGAGACADGTANCVNASGNSYTLTVSSNASHSLAAKAVTYFTASPGPTAVSVACTSPTAGPTFTYTQNACTGVPVPGSCSAWSACTGTCGHSSRTQTCTDAGCGQTYTVTDNTCNPPGTTAVISGQIMNAPQAVQVCASPGSTCSSASITSYSLTVPSSTSYTLSAQTISGYTISPTNYSLSVSCADLTGPTFWYLSDAGIVKSNVTPINSGSGSVSQAGNPPGYNVQHGYNGQGSYTDSTPVSTVNYNAFLTSTLRNAGITKAQLDAACQTPGTLSTANTDFYCYTNSSFDTTLNTAINTGSTSKMLVLYPNSGFASGQQTITTAKNVSGRMLLVFVPDSLEVSANVTVAQNSSSSILFALNKGTTPGDLLVDDAVVSLDGVYVFPGQPNDVYDPALNGNPNFRLTGRGSLISLSASPFILGRNNAGGGGGAGEVWTYEPKYLVIYKNVVATPTYSWIELPPQQ